MGEKVIEFRKKDGTKPEIKPTVDTKVEGVDFVVKYPIYCFPINSLLRTVPIAERAMLLRLIMAIPVTTVVSFDTMPTNVEGEYLDVCYVYPDDVTFEDIHADKVRITAGTEETNPGLIFYEAIVLHGQIAELIKSGEIKKHLPPEIDKRTEDMIL